MALSIPAEVWAGIFLLIQIVNTLINNKFARRASDLESLLVMQKETLKTLTDMTTTQWKIAETMRDIKECVRDCPHK